MDGMGSLRWMVGRDLPVTSFVDSPRPGDASPLQPRAEFGRGGIHASPFAEVLRSERGLWTGFVTQEEHEALCPPGSFAFAASRNSSLQGRPKFAAPSGSTRSG